MKSIANRTIPSRRFERAGLSLMLLIAAAASGCGESDSIEDAFTGGHDSGPVALDAGIDAAPSMTLDSSGPSTPNLSDAAMQTPPPSTCGDGIVSAAAGEVCEYREVVKLGATRSQIAGCGADCRARVERDSCDACMQDRCLKRFMQIGQSADVADFDLISGCFDRVLSNPAAGLNAMPGDPNFNAECRAIVNCGFKHGCWAHEGGPAQGCYCGSNDADQCMMMGAAADARCKQEWLVGVRTTDPTEALARMADSSFPAGMAFEVLECMRTECPSECGARNVGGDGVSDAGR